MLLSSKALLSLSLLSLSLLSLSLSSFLIFLLISGDGGFHRDFVDQRESRERIKRESHETEAWVLVGSVT